MSLCSNQCSTCTMQLDSNINKAVLKHVSPAMEFNPSQRFKKQTIFPQPKQEVASVNKVKMKGLIIQLAGLEPSPQRERRGEREKEKKKSQDLVVLLRPGPSSPMLCSSCKCTSQNKSQMPRAILLSAHTRFHLYTQTQTGAVFLYYWAVT